MEAGGEEKALVAVSLTAEDGQVLLSIQDRGKGIPADILARLGQQGETHGKAGGSGLGLYHARASAASWASGSNLTTAIEGTGQR